jgi:hypothetical protein
MTIITNKFKVLPAIIAISFVAMTGCGENTDSENINTAGMWVKMKADAREDGRTRVNVELNVGGEFGTNVVLSSDEYLEVTAAGVTKRMVEDTDVLDVDYEVYMDTNVSDTNFQISFYRSSGENIVDSYVNLPTAFEITAPLETATFTLEDNVELYWTPERSNESIRLYSSVTCKNSDGNSIANSTSIYVDDSGMYSVDISLFDMFNNGTAGLDYSQPCEMSFSLEREAFGNIDAAFSEGGTFKATQEREVENLRLNLQ